MKPRDYRVFMVVNTLFARLRVTVWSGVFSDRDPEAELRDYDDVSDAIDKSLGSDRGFFTWIGLILTSDETHARERGASRGAFEFEVDQESINLPRSKGKPGRKGARRSS